MDQQITGIAVDDEPIALEIIRRHARKIPFLALKATFTSATAAQRYLLNEPVDVVFLDINMPDLSGLDFARDVRHMTRIIFTTAHPEFAVKGFDLSATDYLLKPIAFPRLMEACVKALQNRPTKNEASDNENYLFVKAGYDWVRININNILFIEADDNYVTFYEQDKKTIVRMTLAAAIEKLSDRRFVRIHKSYVVAFPQVERIESSHVLIAGHKIPMSPGYRDNVRRELNH